MSRLCEEGNPDTSVATDVSRRSNRAFLSVMREERQYYVYIMTDISRRVIYIGVTNDLARRVEEHQGRCVPSFTSKYGLDRLVFFELYDTAMDAITREKQLKGGSRAKKIALIESMNPTWNNLVTDL